jgi:hypothetical protein
MLGEGGLHQSFFVVDVGDHKSPCPETFSLFTELPLLFIPDLA